MVLRARRSVDMRTLFSDLMYALRQMRKAPGFTTVTVLTLALGIGANAAIFTLVHAILLRPLPVKNPGSLYRLGSHYINCCMMGGLQDDWDAFSYPLYLKIKQQTSEIQDLTALHAGLSNASVRRSGDSTPAHPLMIEYVSGNYFDMLGVGPALGRALYPSDDQTGASPAAVMSYRTWQNYYASDPSVVGSTFSINGALIIVVGVAPAEFFGDRLTDTPPDFWLPLATEPYIRTKDSYLNKPDLHWLFLMGRLKPRISPDQVGSKVTVELQQWLSSGEGASTVGDYDRSQISKQKVLALPAPGGVGFLARDAGKGLRMLMALSALVLLIACANIANLLLAKGTARKLHTSVRLALGARRSRLIQQLLTETISLAVLGGVAGVFVAYLGTYSILAIAFRGSPVVPINPEPSGSVMLFSLALSLLTGIVFGVGPAWISSQADPAETLRGASRTPTHGVTLSQKMLVLAQAALSLVLVAGAILMVQSLRKLEHQNFGFQSDHRYIVRVERAFHDYSLEKRAGAYRELQQKLNSIPGVITSSYSMYTPLEGSNWNGPVYFPERTHDSGEHGDYSSWLRVGPDYFETIGTRLIRGRTIGEQDTPTSARVAVVNQRFAQKFFRDQDPIGKHFGSDGHGHERDFEIVGVVEDTKYQDTHAPAYATYFLPYLQHVVHSDPADHPGEESSQNIQTIELHVNGSPENLESTVRQRLAELDSDMTVLRMTTFTEQVSEAFNQERLLARLTSWFGLLALTLASIGLYGVTSYTARRAASIDPMQALAQPAGKRLRIPLALLSGWLIASQLFEVKGHDPIALGGDG